MYIKSTDRDVPEMPTVTNVRCFGKKKKTFRGTTVRPALRGRPRSRKSVYYAYLLNGQLSGGSAVSDESAARCGCDVWRRRRRRRRRRRQFPLRSNSVVTASSTYCGGGPVSRKGSGRFMVRNGSAATVDGRPPVHRDATTVTETDEKGRYCRRCCCGIGEPSIT